MLNPVLLAIPLFLLAIFMEWALARRRGQAIYRLPDALTNLALGMGQLLTGLLLKTPLILLYLWCHECLKNDGWVIYFDPTQSWMWLLAFMVVDFAYYWFHRLSHEVNFLWAGHVIHHQSEDYNLSVALRQSWLQQGFSAIFYVPLAFWLPPKVFIILTALNTLSQFWIHTQLLDRLPRAFETILNTPSHHRVHHAIDAQYIDKNYAGALIIWDRIFGTFELEDQRPRYGILKPLRTWDPFLANLAPWMSLFARAYERPLWRDKILIFLKSPAWLAPGEQPSPERRRDADDYQIFDRDSQLPRGYLIARCTLTLALGIWVTALASGGEFWPTALHLTILIFAFVASGRLLEQTHQHWFLELISGLALIYLSWLAAAFWGFTFASFVWLWGFKLSRSGAKTETPLLQHSPS